MPAPRPALPHSRVLRSAEHTGDTLEISKALGRGFDLLAVSPPEVRLTACSFARLPSRRASNASQPSSTAIPLAPY